MGRAFARPLGLLDDRDRFDRLVLCRVDRYAIELAGRASAAERALEKTKPNNHLPPFEGQRRKVEAPF